MVNMLVDIPHGWGEDTTATLICLHLYRLALFQ